MNGNRTNALGVPLLSLCALIVLLAAAPRSAPAASSASEAVRASKTKITCKPGVITPNGTALCSVSVSDASTGKKVAPAGQVTFATDGPGSFDEAVCTLVPAVSASSCAVRYTASRLGAGLHVLKAAYSGSEVHNPSAATFELPVTPPNDQIRSAVVLRRAPTSVTGTTVGSTTSYSDPEFECADLDGTVWYRYVSPATQKIALRLRANGKLDAAVAVFRQVRSQYRDVACVATDEKGFAGLSFDVQRGGRYFIAVGERDESASSTFVLQLSVPPLAHPPGRLLPRAGASSSVDPLTRPQEAWSVVYAAGTTYRLNVAPERGKCVSVSLFAPKTRRFTAASPLRHSECGGYLVFTPGPDGGGRYSVLVEAEGSRAQTQHYRLHTAPATADDTAPGVLIENGDRRRATLTGGRLDVVDLYRFEVDHRSDVTIGFAASRRLAFGVQLLSSDGRRLGCACEETGDGKLRRRLDQGDYYFAVTALRQTSGRYTVSLLVREITKTTATIDDLVTAVVLPGAIVALSAVVEPEAAAGGRVRMQLDRYDPIEGWQFVRVFVIRVGADARATVQWSPPTVGRWRIHAVFLGTRAASPSSSGYAYVSVTKRPSDT